MRTFADSAPVYASRLGWRVAPCHWPIQRDGRTVCTCIHKPDPSAPERCSCGHQRVASGHCSCGRDDCVVRCLGTPCQRVGKHPRTRHGLKDATTDHATIAGWGRRWPDANVLVATGAESGVVVFDLDRHNPAEDGVEGFRDLCDDLGIELPDTPIQLTGGGGEQWIFRHPGRYVSSACGKSALRPGVEVKGDGGYIVVAPSLHRSGRRYQWDSAVHPLEVEVPEIPGPLLELLSARAKRDRGPATGPASESFLASLWIAAGMRVGFETPAGAVTAECPWSGEHSDARGVGDDSSTVIMPPSKERPLGQFLCSHSHCHGRGNLDVLHTIEERALAAMSEHERFDLALSLLRRKRR